MHLTRGYSKLIYHAWMLAILNTRHTATDILTLFMPQAQWTEYRYHSGVAFSTWITSDNWQPRDCMALEPWHHCSWHTVYKCFSHSKTQHKHIPHMFVIYFWLYKSSACIYGNLISSQTHISNIQSVNFTSSQNTFQISTSSIKNYDVTL